MFGRALVVVAFTLLGCTDRAPESSDARSSPKLPPEAVEPAAPPRAMAAPTDVITPELLRTHTRALSDDAMEGRRPGTPGGARAVEYIVTAMKDLGLEPGGDAGFTQRVPMRGVSTDAAKTSLAFAGPGAKTRPLRYGDDIVGGALDAAGTHALDAPLVFVGYGVTASEYDWDDYAGIDVAGKVVVTFVGDPPTGDERFGGAALTYYGRWTYKFERALEAGALGCIVIHETDAASYGWNVVETSWSSERVHTLDGNQGLPLALSFQGWISSETASALAKHAGATLAAWHERSIANDFQAEELSSRLRGTLATEERRFEDHNVVGVARGSGQADEAVVLSAHWDHLGSDPGDEGTDTIFNGAIDNASGIAGLLGVAAGVRARTKAGAPPSRSVVFLATTGEEQGLLGSRYFAEHPTWPIENIVAAVNIDSMNVAGKTGSIALIGTPQSNLEEALREVARAQQRKVIADERPESGGYYRSDHFSFAKQGVPAIYFRGGSDYGDAEAARRITEERARTYHTVDDEFDPAWSFEGAAQDAEAALRLVLSVADSPTRPAWNPASEFAKIRAPARGQPRPPPVSPSPNPQ